MHEDRIAGNGKLFKGQIRELQGKLPERQVVVQHDADKQLTEWQKKHPDFCCDD